jgi:DnaJ-class molecular chaperone
MARDPYQVLGIDKSASGEEIKRQYRKIAKENHPDLHPGDQEAERRFKEASQAYDILGDEEKRARFDRGEIDSSGQERPETHYYRPYAESGSGAKYRHYEDAGEFADLGSVFEDLFGDRRASPGGGTRTFHEFRVRRRGADVHYTLDVGFLDAARGTDRRVTMADGTTLDLKIPAGTKDGQILRLKGKGQPGQEGGENGDALVSVRVGSHPWFRREGDDIHLTLPVSIREAVLGAKLRVPTIDGPVTMTVPANSSGGDVLRLKGRGVKQGNQFVTLQVQAPGTPDEKLKAFLEENPDVAGGNPRAEMEAG